MRSTTSMMLAPGCRWMLTITAGVCVHPGRLLDVLRRRRSRWRRRTASPARRCGRRSPAADSRWPSAADRWRRWCRPAAGRRSCPWPGSTFAAATRGAQVLQVEAVGGTARRIGLDAHGGLLAAADAHQADARQLRNLLRQARVGQILDLVKRQLGRGQRQRQDRRVGRIGLAVDRRVRQIASAGRSPRR